MAEEKKEKFEYDPFSYKNFNYKDYKESDTVSQADAALKAHLANTPGAYQSQWQTQLNDTINKIMNREKFSYDLNGDALYQQYKDKYIQQGKMAMGDAIGQAAAMTGGYGNSYAQSVGQQAYQASLDNLNDIVPELYQMAYDRYNQEGQNLYNQYSMLGAEEERNYGRYRDSVSDWLSERDYLANRFDSERSFDYSKYTDGRDFAYGKYADDRTLAYDQYSDNKNLSYNEYRNVIEDAFEREKFEYQKEQDRIANEQWQKTFDETQRQFDETQKKNSVSDDGNGNGNSNNNNNNNNPPKEPEEEVPDYSSIAKDLDTFIAGGADRSKITTYIRSALSAGYITPNQAQRLLQIYTPRGYTY